MDNEILLSRASILLQKCRDIWAAKRLKTFEERVEDRHLTRAKIRSVRAEISYWLRCYREALEEAAKEALGDE